MCFYLSGFFVGRLVYFHHGRNIGLYFPLFTLSDIPHGVVDTNGNVVHIDKTGNLVPKLQASENQRKNYTFHVHSFVESTPIFTKWWHFNSRIKHEVENAVPYKLCDDVEKSSSTHGHAEMLKYFPSFFN